MSDQPSAWLKLIDPDLLKSVAKSREPYLERNSGPKRRRLHSQEVGLGIKRTDTSGVHSQINVLPRSEETGGSPTPSSRCHNAGINAAVQENPSNVSI
jgi:hypothetical protein